MSHTLQELAHLRPNPQENAWIHDHDEALMHLSKELGAEGFKLAIERTEGGVEALVVEALRQLRGISKHRDEKGLIITGLLDLTQLGLTKYEAEQRQWELKKPGLVAEADAKAELLGGDEGYGSGDGQGAARPGTHPDTLASNAVAVTLGRGARGQEKPARPVLGDHSAAAVGDPSVGVISTQRHGRV